MMRPSRAEKIMIPSRSRGADDYTIEKSRVPAVCSSVRAEMVRPIRAARITSPSRYWAAEIKAPSCVGLLKVMLDYRG